MPAVSAQHGISHQPTARPPRRILLAILTLLALFLGTAAAQNPRPIAITLVNNSTQTVLFAAFGPSVVEPIGGPLQWIQPPGGSLVLDIPSAWYNTQAQGTDGPRIWARTGCRYNVTENRAQCETGDCAGQFDCSIAGWNGTARVPITGQIPVTIAEFCLNCPPANVDPPIQLNDWDVSVVDGANLMMNVQPTGNFGSTHPGVPGDPFWCQQVSSVYSPNSAPGADLRNANVCPTGWRLTSSMLGMFIKDDPSISNNIVGCFSNCGREEYPSAPCTDPSNPKCGAWKTYCCNDNDFGGNKCSPNQANSPQPGVCTLGDHVCKRLANGSGVCPGASCTVDSDCAPYSKCWLTADGGQNTCACPGYARKTPCPPATCTNVDLPAAEPPYAKCSQSQSLPGVPESRCIGDDTVHAAFPRAYTWPNDPQTYDCNNTTFTITVFSSPSAPITPAGDIPLCSTLPRVYHYEAASKVCADEIAQGAIFASAILGQGTGTPKKQWACEVATGNIPNAGAPPPGVLCSWSTLSKP